MDKAPLIEVNQFKIFKEVYNLSKGLISPKNLILRYFLIIVWNAFFGIIMYFSVNVLKAYSDSAPFFSPIFLIIAIDAFLGSLSLALIFTAIFSFEIYFLLISVEQANLNSSLFLQIAYFSATSIMISYLVNLIKHRQASEVAKLKQQEKLYAQTFIQLNDEYEKAVKNVKARDQFLSIVSHEVKTPMTIMLLKLRDELKKDFTLWLNSIEKNPLAKFSIRQLMLVLKNSEQQIKFMSTMINDLVDVSLITTGRIILDIEKTDLARATKEVVQDFSEMLKREKCKMKIQGKSPVVGRWDKMRIKQIITNLISNAIKYGESKPIEIKIFKSGNYGTFIIKDEGIGIPSQDQKNIFDIFKRVNKKYKKGLGLGLFITAQLIKMHGGTIKVTSVPKKETVFTIKLPLNNTKSK